jgi:hypothetical protein
VELAKVDVYNTPHIKKERKCKMIVKAIEIRDRATFIPAIAIKMSEPKSKAEDYLLRRCGYALNNPAIILLRMDGNSRKAPSDPYDWGDRTMLTTHIYIMDHFDEISNGEVIDVEYILGETPTPKQSEALGELSIW